jgi:hypothetical protein
MMWMTLPNRPSRLMTSALARLFRSSSGRGGRRRILSQAMSIVMLLTFALMIAGPIPFPAPVNPTPAYAQDPSSSGANASLQPAPDDEEPPTGPAITLESRLSALDPDEPVRYFLLGEDLMDEGQIDGARRLFVLASSLDPLNLGRSSCLALAELADREENPDEHKRLLGIARMYPAPPEAAEIELDNSSAIEHHRAAALISAMLGFYRRGEGAKALRSLELNGYTEAIMLEYGPSFGSFADIISYCKSHSRCPECKGELIIKCYGCRGGADPGHCNVCGGDHFIICTDCGGKHGPELTSNEIDHMLNFEVALLSGRKTSWSSQITLDGGRPRPVLEPDSLASSFNIDVRETVYRDGRWMRP